MSHKQAERVKIPVGNVAIEGALTLSSQTKGLVLFVATCDDGKLSRIDRFVADRLRDVGLGTLRVEFADPEEHLPADKRLDFTFRQRRLMDVSTWVEKDPRTESLPLGYFAAGAAVPTILRTVRSGRAKTGAIVCVDGWLELPEETPTQVPAPTLIILSGRNRDELELNQRAYDRLSGDKQLVVIPEAPGLLDEPKSLKSVARLARDWFLRCFSPR
jgi:hypothetical protein